MSYPTTFQGLIYIIMQKKQTNKQTNKNKNSYKGKGTDNHGERNKCMRTNI